jgi:hypothetical protein
MNNLLLARSLIPGHDSASRDVPALLADLYSIPPRQYTIGQMVKASPVFHSQTQDQLLVYDIYLLIWEATRLCGV